MANSDIRFIYENDEGGITIVTPSDKTDLTLDEIKDKCCPSEKTIVTINKSEMPSNRNFRNAWKLNSNNIETDMTKAKEIHKDNIRNARVSKLAELDIEFQKALETSASTTDIVSKKQALRDAPADSAITEASSEAELKSQWNTSILGDSPYV
jgi:hypothetical protein